MREYGQIQCSFWTDPDVQGLSDGAARLAAYLLTGPHSNGLGCYRLPDGYVMADFGWSKERVSKGFEELFRIGFCKRCETTDFVFLPKFLRWNRVANANVATARAKEFDAIPSKFSYYQELCAAILTYADHLKKPFANRLGTLSKGYGKQDPTQPYPIQYDNPDGLFVASEAGDEQTPQDDDEVTPEEPKARDNPSCPHQQIIELYHELLPANPAIRNWTSARAEHLRARWNEDPKRQNLDWWRKFFARIASACPFLVGQKTGRDGRPFTPGLEWLVKAENFTKILEGRYTEDAA